MSIFVSVVLLLVSCWLAAAESCVSVLLVLGVFFFEFGEVSLCFFFVSASEVVFFSLVWFLCLSFLDRST